MSGEPEFPPCPNGQCEHNDLMHDGFPGERQSCYVEGCPCGKADREPLSHRYPDAEGVA